MEDLQSLKNKIIEQEQTIETLTMEVERLKKSLDKHKHVGAKLRQTKRKSDKYKRERLASFLFALLMLGGVIYLYQQSVKNKIEQDKMVKKYKLANPEKPTPGVIKAESLLNQDKE